MWMCTGMRCARRTQVKIGLTVRDPLSIGLRVRHVDRAGDAVDMAAHDLTVAHQLDFRRIANADRRDIRFLEIAVYPVGMGIDNRHCHSPRRSRSLPSCTCKFVT